MENILYESRFTVQKVIDCSKEYDNLARVEMINERGQVCQLDVHNELFSQILSVGTTTDITICTKLVISSDTEMEAGTPAYNPAVAENLQKVLQTINYCMHGTVFEFQNEKNGNVQLFASFGGLILNLSEEPSELVKFKCGNAFYISSLLIIYFVTFLS
uniref:DNA-directed RNA polymerases I, II, and III subunit RPABC3 n=1 Tax=Trepomonas sp. PC1 TaxID=1076344 RepID=A0A146KCZ6_9EUKA|eukprot:JAP94643.1 RNA polymerase II subunit Rpb8 [Trepomonas sp. PC1]